MQVSTYIDNTI